MSNLPDRSKWRELQAERDLALERLRASAGSVREAAESGEVRDAVVKHPWIALGAAAGTGLLAAMLLDVRGVRNAVKAGGSWAGWQVFKAIRSGLGEG